MEHSARQNSQRVERERERERRGESRTRRSHSAHRVYTCVAWQKHLQGCSSSFLFLSSTDSVPFQPIFLLSVSSSHNSCFSSQRLSVLFPSLLSFSFCKQITQQKLLQQLHTFLLMLEMDFQIHFWEGWRGLITLAVNIQTTSWSRIIFWNCSLDWSRNSSCF